MANEERKLRPKTVLKLPDLEQSKSAILNSLTSRSSQRSLKREPAVEPAIGKAEALAGNRAAETLLGKLVEQKGELEARAAGGVRKAEAKASGLALHA